MNGNGNASISTHSSGAAGLEPAAQALENGERHHADEDRAEPGHHVEGVVEQLDVVGPRVLGKRVEAAHVAVKRAVREEAEQSRES